MVNIEDLRQEIRGISRRKRLFKVLKEELSVLGYWRNKSRGNPVKGLEAMQKNRQC